MVNESHRAETPDSRELVTYSVKRGLWRWFLAIEGQKAQAGWAETKQEALLAIALAKNPDPVPHVFRNGRTPTGFDPPV